MGMSFSLVKAPSRRRRRRARNIKGQITRAASTGRFSKTRGVKIASFPAWKVKKNPSRKGRKAASKAKSTRKRARRPGVSWKARYAALVARTGAAARRRASKHPLAISRASGFEDRFMQSNPGGRRRKRRKNARGRRRARRSNPGGFRSRRRGRRHNPVITFRRRRSARRRNPGILGGIKGSFREIFSKDTATQVLAGTVGLSASLWGPKLAGHLVWAPLGRGWGGVATSVVSVGIVSGLTSMASPKAGRAALIGGLIGSFAGAISALHCGMRSRLLPVESSLLACALPTAPVGGSQKQSMIDGLVAGGTPPAVAAMMAQASGLKDFVSAPGLDTARFQKPGLQDYIEELQKRGMQGYDGGDNAAGMQNLLANESAFRRSVGVNDFAEFPGRSSDRTSTASMDASPESF